MTFSAFEELYRRHSGSLYTLAVRMLGVDQAEEGVQDAFLRAWRKLDSYRAEAPFGIWLRRLATRVYIDRLRPAMRDRAQLGDFDPSDVGGNPGLALDLAAAIAELPVRTRAVFVLHEIEGVDHAEVARQLGVDPGTSKSQLHRARRLLRARLTDRDEEFHERSLD